MPDRPREAREAAGLSFCELAKRAGISAVMPSRYEKADHSNATLPNAHTLDRLNKALFGAPENHGLEEHPLARFSTDDIVAELKRRGATSISINW